MKKLILTVVLLFICSTVYADNKFVITEIYKPSIRTVTLPVEPVPTSTTPVTPAKVVPAKGGCPCSDKQGFGDPCAEGCKCGEGCVCENCTCHVKAKPVKPQMKVVEPVIDDEPKKPAKEESKDVWNSVTGQWGTIQIDRNGQKVWVAYAQQPARQTVQQPARQLQQFPIQVKSLQTNSGSGCANGACSTTPGLFGRWR